MHAGNRPAPSVPSKLASGPGCPAVRVKPDVITLRFDVDDVRSFDVARHAASSTAMVSSAGASSAGACVRHLGLQLALNPDHGYVPAVARGSA